MIILRTVLDLKAFRSYYFFNLKRRKSFMILMFLAVLGIIYTGVTLIVYSINGKEINILSLAPFLVLMGIYFVYYILLLAVISTSYSKNAAAFKTPLLYYFYNDHFEVAVEGSLDKNNNVKVNYSDLIYIFDAPNFYYIINKNKKMYIIKKDFIEGNSVELNMVFRSINSVTIKKVG